MYTASFSTSSLAVLEAGALVQFTIGLMGCPCLWSLTSPLIVGDVGLRFTYFHFWEGNAYCKFFYEQFGCLVGWCIGPIYYRSDGVSWFMGFNEPSDGGRRGIEVYIFPFLGGNVYCKFSTSSLAVL
jgi:hypothetical protein